MILFIKILIFFICCVILATYMSLIERKLIAKIQLRKGPNSCGVFGTLQPIADAFKLLLKKEPFVGHSNYSISAVLFLFATTLGQLSIIPLSKSDVFCPEHGFPLIILFQSVVAFCEIMIGTSSKSKYGTIGGNRAYLQLLGGHISLILSIIVFMSISKSMSLFDFLNIKKDLYVMIKYTPVAIIFFTSLLISGNRTPFDFTEAESELVGGAYVEYGGIMFALIFLSDYLNLLFISALTATLFLGGYSSYLPFSSYIVIILKTIAVSCCIILIRAILPRYSQYRMIKLSWGIFIPILCLYIISN